MLFIFCLLIHSAASSKAVLSRSWAILKISASAISGPEISLKVDSNESYAYWESSDPYPSFLVLVQYILISLFMTSCQSPQHWPCLARLILERMTSHLLLIERVERVTVSGKVKELVSWNPKDIFGFGIRILESTFLQMTAVKSSFDIRSEILWLMYIFWLHNQTRTQIAWLSCASQDHGPDSTEEQPNTFGTVWKEPRFW